jgi:hypothetical protein
MRYLQFLLLPLMGTLLSAPAWADTIVTFDVSFTTLYLSTAAGTETYTPISIDFALPVTFDIRDAVIGPLASGGIGVQIDPAETYGSEWGHVLGAGFTGDFTTYLYFGADYVSGSEQAAYSLSLEYFGVQPAFDAAQLMALLGTEEREGAQFSVGEALNQFENDVFVGGAEWVGTATIASIEDPPENVPEPATLWLLAPGLLAFFARQRKRY